MKPKLVSFELCPFVQRSVITLKKKGVDFDIEYIDLENKPDWFLKISPLGKVPVVQIGEEILFESAVINEYLDETNPPSLHSADPLQKAKDRAWIEFGSQILMNSYMLTVAKSEEDFEKQKEAFKEKLTRLENEISDSGPFFRGEDFRLIDCALAPIFQRVKIMDDIAKLQLLDGCPKLLKYAEHLIKQSFVEQSLPPNFDDKFTKYLTGKDSFLGVIIARNTS